MKNKRLSTLAGVLLAGTLGSALVAHDATGFQIGGSLLQAMEASKQQAGLSNGFGVWAGYGIKTAVGDVVIRPTVGINLISGQGVEGVYARVDEFIGNGEPYKVPGSSLKHQLTNIQVTGDALIPIFGQKMNLVLGLSVNKYSVKVSGAREGEYSPVDLDAATRTKTVYTPYVRSGDANGTHSAKGMKLGVRFGVEYHVTKQLDVRLLFQQTELGRSEGEQGQLPTLQPFWADLGVVFRF